MIAAAGRLLPTALPHSCSASDDRMPKTDRHHLELIVLIGALAAIGPLSIDTYLPSMPAIAAQFAAASSLVQQSVSAYFVGLAAGQIICGPFSDRFGRRPVLFAGLGLYLAATLACVLAPTIGVLIAGRALQGLGASATPAAGRAVIRDIWSGDRAARAMSFVMMVMAFAPLIAPTLGGQIYAWFGWRAIFWLMAGFGVLLIVLVQFRLPETNGPERRAGVNIGDYFRAYGRVLADAPAWGYLLAGGLSYAAMFAYITGAPFVYIEVFNVDPAYFGLFFAVNVIGLTLGNWLNSRFVDRLGYLPMLGIGTAVSAAGVLALLICALTAAGGLIAVAVTLFVAIAPVGMNGANAIAGMLNLYPKNAGAASALFGVSQFGFGAVAGILVGVFYTGTPVAMALAMMTMAAGALVAWLWLRLLVHPAVAAGE